MTLGRLHSAFGRQVNRLLFSILLVFGGLSAASGTAMANTTPIANKVQLTVLVLSDGTPNVVAIAAQLAEEGVPTTVVDLTSPSRPVIDRAFLADDAAHIARFQGVVLPGVGALSAAEATAVAGFERDYGIREVVAYAYPSASVGMTTPSFSGTLDGSALTVSPAGSGAGFGYLTGQLRIDDVDSAVAEVYGYLASGISPEPAGESYVPLIAATHDGVSGSVVGVYSAQGRSQMVITAAFDANQRYFQEIGHGIVTWLTRGIHLGYQRNYFTVHVDDVFMADSQWSPEGRCTPGDDCYGAASGIVTADIRMQPADVSHAVAWQQASGVKLDMVFNGGGSDDFLSDNPALTTDPLVTAFAANASSFGWINHTLSHEYLGCIQVAPPAVNELWHCATAADYANPATVFIEPDLAANHAQLDPGTGYYFLTAAEINDQITRNRTWAQQHGFTINPSELVTGEHSGLAILPEQPIDNPNFAPVLSSDQIGALASDASRETASRAVGPALTVPRHPMNIFYNVSTYLGEVSEYNWYYTPVADGGGGACEAHPDVTQCITPLADATAAQAQSSFNSYILPLEVRNALGFVLSNDPRPFYVHQSNLTGQRIVYPVLDGIVAGYSSVYNAATTPLVQLTMTQQAEALSRMTAWKSAMAGVTAYVDQTGVHIDSGSTSAAIPVTVPAGSTVSGMSVATYSGEQSGWIAPGTAPAVTIGLPTSAGGYVGVPAAPTIGTVTGGNASATVSWAAGPDRGSQVTGFTVRAYVGANITPSATVAVTATATSASFTGLINYAPYSFTVIADSAVGSSDESAHSATVIPAPAVPGAPIVTSATAGDGTATVTWQAPNDGGSPVTLYTARLYLGNDTAAVFASDVASTQLSATFTGLTNGVSYSMDVFAYNNVGPGPVSARSALVTPGGVTTAPTSTTTNTPATTSTTTFVSSSPTIPPPPLPTTSTPPTSTTSAAARVPGIPRVTAVTAGNRTISVRWTAPADHGSPITSYRVLLYRVGAQQPVNTTEVNGAARSVILGNLTNGVRYQVSVQAVNVVGAGTASGRFGPVTPRGSAPGLLQVAATQTGTPDGHGAAIVRWSVPLSDGGSLITGFVVVAQRLDASGAVTSTGTVKVSSPSIRAIQMILSSGRYSFTVRALNNYGTGKPSAVSNIVTVQ